MRILGIGIIFIGGYFFYDNLLAASILMVSGVVLAWNNNDNKYNY